jgi:putative ABC transport system permease protein
MTCVAAVALLVAALGIANTMLMSVLERTREIGIMKAVGAGNGHLLCVFLLEGALIGLCGGALGLLFAWGASFPGDAWVRSMVTRDLKIDLQESLFAFPPWLLLTVLLFAVAVTTAAAVYPARRAALVHPVAALRHE